MPGRPPVHRATPSPSCAAGGTQLVRARQQRRGPGPAHRAHDPARLRRRAHRRRRRPAVEVPGQRERQGAGLRQPAARAVPQRGGRLGPARRRDPPGAHPGAAPPRLRAPAGGPALRAGRRPGRRGRGRHPRRRTPRATGPWPSCSTWCCRATSCRSTWPSRPGSTRGRSPPSTTSRPGSRAVRDVCDGGRLLPWPGGRMVGDGATTRETTRMVGARSAFGRIGKILVVAAAAADHRGRPGGQRPARPRAPARCAPAASSSRSRPTRVFDTRDGTGGRTGRPAVRPGRRRRRHRRRRRARHAACSPSP